MIHKHFQEIRGLLKYFLSPLVQHLCVLMVSLLLAGLLIDTQCALPHKQTAQHTPIRRVPSTATAMVKQGQEMVSSFISVTKE